MGEPDSQDYLFSILESDIMPLVDVVSWHPMYGTSPEFDSEYYYEYPSIMQEIKNVASAHGFEGDYEADELTWFTLDGEFWDGWSRRCSDTIAAKYQARGIIMHLGTNVTAGIGSALIFDTNWVLIPSTVQNLCSVMTGHEPAILSIQVQSTITNTVSYTFSMPKENYLIALWDDSIAVDIDPGTPTTLTIPRFSDHEVTGIDVLHGFQQQLITSEEDGELVIRDLLVKDYPIFLRLYEPKYLFLPSILNTSVDREGGK